MKNKLEIILVLLMLTLSLSAVYSVDGTSLANVMSDKLKISNDSSHMNMTDGKLILENVTFNIPDGFKEDKKSTQLDFYSDDPSFEGIRGSRCVFNNGDDHITYMVGYSLTSDSLLSQVDLLEESEGIHKTIANKDGIFSEENGEYAFLYKTENGYVELLSNKEDLISHAII